MKQNQPLLLDLGKALILRLADAKEQARMLACSVLLDLVQVRKSSSPTDDTAKFVNRTSEKRQGHLTESSAKICLAA